MLEHTVWGPRRLTCASIGTVKNARAHHADRSSIPIRPVINSIGDRRKPAALWLGQTLQPVLAGLAGVTRSSKQTLVMLENLEAPEHPFLVEPVEQNIPQYPSSLLHQRRLVADEPAPSQYKCNMAGASNGHSDPSTSTYFIRHGPLPARERSRNVIGLRLMRRCLDN